MTLGFPKRAKSRATTAPLRPKRDAQSSGRRVRKPTHLAAVLQKVSFADLDGNPPAHEVMRILTVSGKSRWIALLRSNACSPKHVLSAALNAGAALPSSPVQAKHLVNKYIASEPQSVTGVIVTRGGWYKPGHIYVRNNRVIRRRPQQQEITK